MADASTITNTDPAAGGVGYAWTVVAGANDTGTFQDHCGAWSWEDESLFAPGEPPVGWTHTSRWVAVTLEQETVLTVTLARDATVPYAQGPGGLADATSMFPSLTLWKNWDNDDEDFHSYNNRGNVAWAEDLQYVDHVDNSTATTITRSWILPAGNYTLALGSNAPATNTNRQGFSFTFSTAVTAPVDLVPNTYPEEGPATGGIGYGHTIVVNPGQNGSFKEHVGAWSWEDNALFTPGQPPVGWTHTSHWVDLTLKEDLLLTIKMDRDATVPWPSAEFPDRLADTTSMFPSFTLFRSTDQDGSDHHTYNNKGRVAWAEDITYLDHLNNSTQTTVSRTWRLPAGTYTMVMGSNAPATNTNRQGFKFDWSAKALDPIALSDPGTGGVGYTYTIVAGAGDSGSVKNHVGAWSWEDNALFSPGQPPVGWTHTSRWVALLLKDPVTFSVTMSRDATVPWVSGSNPDPNQLADTTSMFPSLTLWSGWDNDNGDSHMYNNRGNISWAEDLEYIDHVNNSTQTSFTRSWTLPAGRYTFALGSNAPANNTLRQGFSFAYATSAPIYTAPVITKQPASLALLAGKKASFAVTATGPSLAYQWFKGDVKLDNEDESTLVIDPTDLEDIGSYTVEVRNAAGAVTSSAALLGVTAKPVMNTVTLPDAVIGALYTAQVTASNEPVSFTMTGKLPKGLAFNSKTGTITGRPLVIGDFTVSFKGINKAGSSDTAQGDSFIISNLLTGTQGIYNGVIDRSPSLNEFLGGSIRITTTAVGGFTGTLLLGTKSYQLGGPLDTSLAAPTGSQTIVRKGQPVLNLSFTIDPAMRQLSGFVADGPQSVAFSARQAVSPATSYQGNYTLALKLAVDDQGDDDVPQGHGFGAFTVSANGAANGVITLADETKVTFSGPIEQMGNLSLFKLLYSNLGSLVAVLHIEATESHALDDSYVNWFKKSEALNSKGRVYKSGFGPLYLQTIGRKYSIPATATTLPMGLSGDSPNAKLTFADGGAPNPAVRLNTEQVIIVAGSPKVATFGTQNPGFVTLKLTPGTGTAFVAGTTGSFTGTFKLTDDDTSVTPTKPLSRTVKFNGMIVDDGTTTKGYGNFLLPEMPVAAPVKTTINTSKKLSGSVLLEGIPATNS